jgi:hypothetical protein
MMRDVLGSDWKLFRALRQVALERFCERTLHQIAALSAASQRTSHERYLDVCRRIDERDNELAQAVNDMRRSRMLVQPVAMRALRLVEDHELARFSDQTQETVAALTKPYEPAPRAGNLKR